MLAKRVRAVLPLSFVLGVFVLAGPALAGAGTITANDDGLSAYPTGVVDVLANDSASSNNFTVVSNTQPAHGQASCSALGACSYKANPGFTGNDTFTYTAREASGPQDTATVNV